MARDIKIRAILDDQVSGQLGKLSGNLKGLQSSGSKTVSQILGNAEQQTAQILQQTGGNGLLGQALLGAGAGAGGAGLSKAFSANVAKTVTESLKSSSVATAVIKAAVAGNAMAGRILGQVMQETRRKIPGSFLLDTLLGPADALKSSIKKTMGEVGSVMSSSFKWASGVEIGMKGILGAAAGAGVAVAAFTKIMSDAAKRADEFDAAAQKLGVGVVQYQELAYAAQRLNVDMGSLSTAYRTLSNAALESVTGNKEFARVFDALGVSVKDAGGALKEPAKLFDDVLGALGKIQNTTVRNALAQKTLGRAYQDLIPILNAGKSGMADLREEAHKLGVIMSEEQVAKLNQTQDAFEKFAAATRGSMQTFAAENATLTTRWLTGLTDMVTGLGGILGKVPKMWETIVHALGASIKFLETAFETAGTALGAALMIGITGGMLAGVTLLKTTIGQLLPQGMQDSLTNVQAQMTKFMDSSVGMVSDKWKAGWADVKKEWDKINQIWEDDATPAATKKTENALEALLALLKKLNKEKSKEIDMDLLWVGTFLNITNRKVEATKKEIDFIEKRQKVVDESITAYEQLAEIAMKAAGVDSPLQEQKLRLLSEERALVQGITEDYREGLISYKAYTDGLANADKYYAQQHTKVVTDSVTGMMEYGIQLFDSMAGLANQISENQLKAIDKWETSEQRKIENSLLSEEYKQQAMDKLAQKAESKRKEEFQEMQALNIVLAIINTAAGVTKELATGGVYGIITGLLVAAAGAAEIATIAAQSYAQGGVVPGNSFSGDKVPARVNSGEMILTREDQGELLSAIRSGGAGAANISAPIVINGNADASTVTSLKNAQEKQIEQLRSLVLEAKSRGRWPA